MKIVLTGGGTAGHVTPNIALIPHLRKHFNEICYIGSENGIENNLIKDIKDIKFYPITTVKFIRGFTLKNLLIPFKLIKGINDAKKILKTIKPTVIFSKGGFVAVPVVIAAKQLKIPIIAHESDSTMGLANKIIYKYCNKMCFSFNNFDNKYKKKGLHTGSPIRDELFNPCKNNPYNNLEFNKTHKTILVTGGSLGASAINNVIFNNIEELTKEFNILHIVGKNNLNKQLINKYKNYKQIEYCKDMQNAFDIADIVISRAGSNTIFELLALKKLFILVPLPKGNSRGDQIDNANIFKSLGYCEVINQEEFNVNNLRNTLLKMIKNKNTYMLKMKTENSKNANKEITNIIIMEAKRNI